MNLWIKSIKDISRHKLSSFLIFFVLSITVFLSLVFILFMHNLKNIEKKWSRNIVVSIFPVPGADIDKLILKLQAIGSDINIKHLKPNETLKILKKKFSDQNIVFSASDMPELLELKINANRIDFVSNKLKDIEEIEDFIVSSKWYNNLSHIIYIIKYALLVVIIFVLVLSIVLITYASRLSAYQRVWEIKIFRLFGATEWHIRLPYVFSGLILAVLGSISGFLIYFFFIYVLGASVDSVFSFWLSNSNFENIPVFYFWIVLFFTSVSASLINFIAFLKNGEG